MTDEPAKLRTFALNLDRSDWDNDKGYAFYCQSRAFCNFVERALAAQKLKLLCPASKIVIEGALARQTSWYVNSSNIVCVTVPFDGRRFEALKTAADKQELFLSFARRGLDVVTSLPRATRDALERIFGEFRAGGYTNTWQHKKRTFREQKWSAALDCSLTIDDFELVLTVTAKDGPTFRRSLLCCDADELAFHHRFKDVAIEGEHLVVSSRTAKPLARIPLREIKRALTD